MATLAPSSGTIHASLNHLAKIPLWREEKPWESWTETVPEGLGKTTNVQFETIDDIPMVDVRDLRKEPWPTLEREGFQYLNHPFPDIELLDVEGINEYKGKRDAMAKYLSIMTIVLRDMFKGTKAVCYDWRVRKALPRKYDISPSVFFRQVPEGVEIREQLISAAYNVHGDGAPNSFKKQLLYLLTPEEQLDLANKKVRIQAVKYSPPLCHSPALKLSITACGGRW